MKLLTLVNNGYLRTSSTSNAAAVDDDTNTLKALVTDDAHGFGNAVIERNTIKL
jgi:hypothetical protein